MSKDTIPAPPSELPTERDHEIPSAPPEVDVGNTDAPQWAKEIILEMRASRRELADTFRDWSHAFRQLIENQEATLAEVRKLSDRVDAGERRMDAFERRLHQLEQRANG